MEYVLYAIGGIVGLAGLWTIVCLFMYNYGLGPQYHNELGVLMDKYIAAREEILYECGEEEFSKVAVELYDIFLEGKEELKNKYKTIRWLKDLTK